MKVVPLGDNVVVRRIDAPTSTIAGIVLPETLKESSTVKAIATNGKRILFMPRTPLERGGGKKGDQTPDPACYSTLSM